MSDVNAAKMQIAEKNIFSSHFLLDDVAVLNCACVALAIT
jgi:hypothetical protein